MLPYLAPLVDDPAAKEPVAILRRDFADVDALGPRRVAEFLTSGSDDSIQAEVVSAIETLLGSIDELA